MALPAISATSGVAPCRALVPAERRHVGRQAPETLPGPAARRVAVTGGAGTGVGVGYRAAAPTLEPPEPDSTDRRGLADFFVRGLAPSTLGRLIDTYA